jgi:hypothetical protein
MSINNKELTAINISLNEGLSDNDSIYGYVSKTLSITRRFHNGGSNPIIIYMRSGIRYEVKNNNYYRKDVDILHSPYGNNNSTTIIKPTTDELWVKDEYKVPYGDAIYLYSYYTELSNKGLLKENTTEYLFAMGLIREYSGDLEKSKLTQSSKVFESRIYNIVIDYIVYLNDIVDGYYYNNVLDLVITNNTEYCQDIHPMFNNNIGLNTVDGHFLNKGLHVNIVLIDNENNYSDKYVNILGNTIVVKSVKSIDNKSGVYITTYKYNSDINKVNAIVDRVLTVDEAMKEFIFYDTKEEAISGLNPQQKHEDLMSKNKQELELYKVNSLRQQGELVTLKDKITKEQAIREEEILKFKQKIEIEAIAKKHEDDRIKLSREDYFSERAYRRSDTSDASKYLPGLLIAGIGAVIAFNKLM